MKKILKLALMILVAGISAATPISAEEPVAPKAKTAQSAERKSEIPPIKEPKLEEDPKSVKMKADRLLYDDKTKVSRLTGNVKIVYGDAEITSKYAIFHGETKEAFFSGGVVMRRPKTVLSGEKMDVFYNESRAVVKENVRAVSYQKQEKEPGKKESSPDDEAPLILTCRQAEYIWGTEDAYADGNVKVWKNDKRAYADHSHYSQKAGTVVLTENVRFEQGAGNWMTCPEAVFDIKEETFSARGGVNAEIEIPENDKKDADSKDSKAGKKDKSSEKEPKKTLPEDRIILDPIMPAEDDETIFVDDNL